MKKYYIVSTKDTFGEFKAETREDAMKAFISSMDSDQHAYFEAVTEDELLKRSIERDKREIMGFMEDEIRENYDEVPEEDVKDVAARAYEMYVSGDYNYTQYDCIEAAVQEHEEAHEGRKE